MTVYNDLERAIAMAEAAKGSYMLFSTESEDGQATKVFKEMAQDMQRHVTVLESRLEYLNEHNKLNAGGGIEGGQSEGGQAEGQKPKQSKDKEKKQQE